MFTFIAFSAIISTKGVLNAMMVIKIKNGGDVVSRRRVERGMSMRELSEKSGMSVAAISKLENGCTTTVRPANAQRISKALEADLNELFVVDRKGGQ